VRRRVQNLHLAHRAAPWRAVMENLHLARRGAPLRAVGRRGEPFGAVRSRDGEFTPGAPCGAVMAILHLAVTYAFSRPILGEIRFSS
jgi:hypothetical protein